jgi:hypothetical protein
VHLRGRSTSCASPCRIDRNGADPIVIDLSSRRLESGFIPCLRIAPWLVSRGRAVPRTTLRAFSADCRAQDPLMTARTGQTIAPAFISVAPVERYGRSAA